MTIKFDPDLIAGAMPGTIATLSILLAHELGHVWMARKEGLSLGPPLLIPAGLGLLGSFGGITRTRDIVQNRRQLASLAIAGPLMGSAVSLGIALIGLVLTSRGIGGVEVDSASFRDSLVIGTLSRSVFGDRVFTAASLNCNPLFVAGWGGLIINAINAIPAGELDGGKAFLGMFGRPAASRMSVLSLFLLGVLGFSSSLGLFWLLLVLSLQRGPTIPCAEEISPIPQDDVWAKWGSLMCLIIPLIVLLPFPFGLEDSTSLLEGGGAPLPPF